MHYQNTFMMGQIWIDNLADLNVEIEYIGVHLDLNLRFQVFNIQKAQRVKVTSFFT